MSFFSIFLVTVFFLFIIFLILRELLNTSAARIFFINLKYQEQEKEKYKEIEQIKQKFAKDAKDADKFLEIIIKIKKGEKVKIPLGAFEYIYRNIDDIVLLDDDYNLTIVDQKSFLEFKSTVEKLLIEHEVKPIEFDKFIKEKEEKELELIEEKNKIAKLAHNQNIEKSKDNKVFNIIPDQDGKFIVADNSEEVLKKDGKIISYKIDTKKEKELTEQKEAAKEEQTSEEEMEVREHEQKENKQENKQENVAEEQTEEAKIETKNKEATKEKSSNNSYKNKLDSKIKKTFVQKPIGKPNLNQSANKDRFNLNQSANKDRFNLNQSAIIDKNGQKNSDILNSQP